MKQIIIRTTDSKLLILASQYKNGFWKVEIKDEDNNVKKEINKSISESHLLATIAILTAGKQLIFKNLEETSKNIKKLIMSIL